MALVCSASMAFAQKSLPLRVAVSNEATAIPFTKLITTPFHPCIQLGTEFRSKTRTHSRVYYTANMGYIFHNYLYQGVYVNLERGYDYKITKRFSAKGLFGLGYLHTFTTQEEYSLIDGEYRQKGDKGNARLMPMVSLGFGYKLKNASEVFVLYKSWAEYPYSPGFIPVMSHINLELGLTINASKNESK